jgi:hypothetical protein
VASRFPLCTEADVDGPVVKALWGAAWDVLRGIDTYPERTRDHIHFARLERRVLASNDIDMKAIAEEPLVTSGPAVELVQRRPKNR